MGRGSFPRPDFRSSSSHRASGIVHHEGDQMPSRQLFGSSRLDRDHLTGSGRRAAPLVTRRSLRNARGELSAETLTGQSGGTFQGLFTRDAADSSAPGTKLLAFDRWYFPSDSQPGPRRCHGRASTIEQVHFKLRPVRPPWRY